MKGCPAIEPQKSPSSEPDLRRSANGRYSSSNKAARLITRDQLDGRTKAAQKFDAIAEGIARDLGGEEHLSTVQKHLVEAFAGAALHVHDANARLLLGQPVDIVEHSTAISTMVRIASRIGLRRVARDVTTLGDLLRADIAEQREHHD